jgi:predicted nucleic acid-binding protein
MNADRGDAPKVFVDTNVLLYAFDTSAAGKRRLALDVVREAWRGGNGCVSVQVLQEFYVNATRELERPVTVDTATRIVASLSHWEVHAPDANDVLSAIVLQRSAQLSFWDATVVTSAQAMGCEQLDSEDLNAGNGIGGVTVVNPFAGRP